MPAQSSSPILERLSRRVGDAPSSGVLPERLVDLLELLGAVPDPRKARGVRHRAVTVLAVGLCAVLAGARSFVAIAEWATDLLASVRLRLGVGARRMPSESTIRRVLEATDPDALHGVLSRWLLARCPDTVDPHAGPTVIAIDGKTARGARRCGGGATHLLAALDTSAGVVLGQVEVDGKTNEISAFVPLCKQIAAVRSLAGTVFTADAMHCQREHVEHLHKVGAHWLLVVKGNQPTLHRQLRTLPWAEVQDSAQTREKGHGRLETRTLRVVEVAAGIGFPHATRALRMIRRRRPAGGGKWSTETVYAITDTTWAQMHPPQLAEAMRRHWEIENRLHWVRDVSMDEDRCRVRAGARALAAIRNLVLSLIRARGLSVPEARENFREDRAEAVAVVTGRIL